MGYTDIWAGSRCCTGMLAAVLRQLDQPACKHPTCQCPTTIPMVEASAAPAVAAAAWVATIATTAAATVAAGAGEQKLFSGKKITGRTKTMALRETAARLHARLAMQLVPALGAGVSMPVRSRRPRRRAWLAIPRPPEIHLGHRHGFAHTLHDGCNKFAGCACRLMQSFLLTSKTTRVRPKCDDTRRTSHNQLCC